MTTEEKSSPGPSEAATERLQANLAQIEAMTQRLIAALAQRRPADPALAGPSPEVYLKAATAFWQDAIANPARLVEQQAGYWGSTLRHYIEAQQALAQGKVPAPAEPAPKDRRFTNPLWDTHPYFNYLRQQYLLNARAVEESLAALEGLPPKDRQRVEYFTRQIVDMMAPTNFFGTNPDALERAVETEGESLVRGLQNLVRDVEANNGELLVTLSDPDAFSVGDNIGATEGAVVFRNRLFELIQYTPTTEKVHRTPLLIFPPWINKFYILDLKPQNSLIKWIVDQGFTLFVVSWVNPDESYRDTGMDDYIKDGFLTAIDTVKAITKEDKINAVGYCIAGTTLSLTLAMMQKRGDPSVKSVTFFTTLTDFADQGEFGVFLTDDFVDGIAREVAESGILHRVFMARTFSYLRSNDLIYQPAIRSYMMGDPPPAFDLLYWNGDGTNLPGRMAVEYLRGLCQENRFVEGTFEVDGEPVSVKDVKVPLCAIACETDHIAAWKSSFNGIRQMGSKDKTFILSESGHIAGIVNPPSKGKYGHYLNPGQPLTPATAPEEWLKGAAYEKGSWWPVWGAWLAKRSGAMVAARQPGDSGFAVLAPAPGTYVRAEAPR
ncbi:PHA/PHB synthase family protein [Ruixingdingia sedimenti]|uniref:Class I poly(R)-hydroxyalkanoic acid synthase n=1 Tax=Ruixingdingia sedimenti TaxID=3073604 RepID=A0ABU1F5P0_9RHOB|nr:class I poly(R)-hydroxyalkanoic acid synthase [Xinfangfangia sp. LG-4]MDR5652189.1 class I poly(R)-hydroxyalkanoic acid synthase [Xinfangfangia sp. LG-4]